MKILVLGGTGFIGRHLAFASVRKGWSVVATGLRNERPSYLDKKIKYIQFDLAGPAPGVLIQEKFDYVVNLSGYIKHGSLNENYQEIFNEHFFYLINFINSLNKDNLKAFLQVGSSDEYGNLPPPQVESSKESPFSIYSLAKLSSTRMMQMLFEVENFPSIVLRPFLVYGPGQDSSRYLPYVINQSIRGLEFPVSEGSQLRDFCYVEDVARGMIELLEQKKSIGKVINIGSGKPITLREVTELVIKKIGSGKPNYGSREMRVGEPYSLYPDLSLIRGLINWNDLTKIEDGLEKTIKWYMTCH